MWRYPVLPGGRGRSGARAGIRAEHFDDKAVFGRLRELARRGMVLGGVCTGSLALARAGLLDGYRCTIHWENMPAFSEAFPEIHLSGSLFEVDRDRFTCAGGTASLIAVDRTEESPSAVKP